MRCVPLHFEDKTTRCPTCNKPLTWKSHSRRWNEDREIEEFHFACDVCGRRFVFRDDKLFEKKPNRDVAAEATAIHRLAHADALNRRCSECGGPLSTEAKGLQCQWCWQLYELREGNLTALPFVEPKPKRQISDFYE